MTMNVNTIAETYTQLGRLGRGMLQRPDNPGAQVSREEVENQVAEQVEKAVRARLAADDAARLTLAEAHDLTNALTDFIMSGQWPVSGGRVHDISSINLIVPRYV